jgi:hypothetical protein
MTKICVVDTNNLNYTPMDNNHDRIKINLLEEDIEDYVTSININDELDLIMKILEVTKATSDMMVYTTSIYEEREYVYQMCHLSTYTESKETENINKKIIGLKKNGIANILCDNMYNVYGKTIVLKYKINSDYTVSMVNLDFNDFLKLFANKKINKGVYISVNGDLKDIEYVGNPLSWIPSYEKMQNYRYYEKEIMGKIFMFFIEVKPSVDKVNKFATSMYNSLIKGNIFIAVRNKVEDINVTEPVYYNISSDLINKLKHLIEDDNFSVEQEPFYYDQKNKKYQGFWNFVDKTYIDYDFNKALIRQIDYESKSLNEITQSLLTK